MYRILVELVVSTHTYITSCLPTSLLSLLLLYQLETTLIFTLPDVKVSYFFIPSRDGDDGRHNKRRRRKGGGGLVFTLG
jgi:hypothetical protein